MVDELSTTDESAEVSNTEVPVATIAGGERTPPAASADDEQVGSGDRSGGLGHELAGAGDGSTTESDASGQDADSEPTPESDTETETESDEPLEGSGACTARTIGKEDGPIVSAYFVVNGQLGDLCLGTENQTMLDAWDALAEIAPPQELDAIEVFAGFEPRGTGTIAFVVPVDFDFERFVMAIDVEESAADMNELRLTLAHELTHVFVQLPDQIDLNAGPDDCDTYYNGFGCFLPGSYMAQWVAEFWEPEDLAALPASGGLDEDGAVERCETDAGFIGEYSATHPEEDFAEAFSAYVFDVRVKDEARPRYDFFERYPELVAFRDRAAAADRLGIRNLFGGCG